MKCFPIVLGFIWLPVIWPIKESFQRVGNPPTVARIGGVMTGGIVPLEEKSMSHHGLSLRLIQMRENRHLREDRQMYWTSGRGIDPQVGVRWKFFGRNQPGLRLGSQES